MVKGGRGVKKVAKKKPRKRREIHDGELVFSERTAARKLGNLLSNDQPLSHAGAAFVL